MNYEEKFLGIVIIFLGLKKIGLGLVLSAIISITLILGLSIYTKYVALIGLLCILIGIYFLGKEILNKNRFEKDLIKTVELAKDKLTEDELDRLAYLNEALESYDFSTMVRDPLYKPLATS